MTPTDPLAALLAAWRADIDSVPHPDFTASDPLAQPERTTR
ncbi:hypothetical protein [Amycolatopsis thermoflava]